MSGIQPAESRSVRHLEKPLQGKLERIFWRKICFRVSASSFGRWFTEEKSAESSNVCSAIWRNFCPEPPDFALLREHRIASSVNDSRSISTRRYRSTHGQDHSTSTENQPDMQRYNPPSTSAQADCFGCNRQLHKIQELMDQTYLLNVSHQIEMNKMSHRVRVLERHLSCERLRIRRNEALMNNDVLDEGMKDETVKELLEINEKLNDDLLKTSEEAETFPFEEWKKAIDGKWSDQYEELKEFALSKQDEVERLNRQIRKQKEEIAKYKKQVEQMKKVNRTNDDQLETLMRSSAFPSGM